MKSGYESGYKTRRRSDIASSGAGLPAQLPFNVCVRVVANAWHTLEQEQIPSVHVVIAVFTCIAALDLVHALT